MKEFIEKLIKGISNKKDYFQRLYECEGKTEHDADLNKATQLAFDDCLSVIEQLAEEYNNDFCEREKGSSGYVGYPAYYSRCCTTNGLEMQTHIISDWKFCPYCGKQIKVVE